MKTITILLFLSLSFLSTNSQAKSGAEGNELRAFATDYCSKWPEGNKEDPSLWADCCFTHDLHYWIGGTEEMRKSADKELKSCVKLSGASVASFLMYMGVRMGGNPGEADYAWGFGWSEERGYEEISPEDVQTGKSLLESSEYNQTPYLKTLIDQFITDVLSLRLTNEQ